MAQPASHDSQLCRVDGCGNKIDIKKHQLCSKHHQAFWKYGDPLGSPNKPRSVPCSAPGCERTGSGITRLCQMHSLRLQRTGQLDLKRRERPICSVAGCSGRATAKGLCKGHYDKERGSLRRTPRICSDPGCNLPAKARGLCCNHYSRLQRQGALHTAPLSRTVTVSTRPRPCRGCGGDLAGPPRGQRYCSDACKPRCTGPGCNRKASGRGLCSTHLKQHNTGITLRPVGERVIRAPNQPCNWCGDPVGPESAACYCSLVCRSLARRHTAAATAGNCAQCGSAIDYLGQHPPTTCSVVDCEHRPESHGMCQKHRRRVMKYGTTELPYRPSDCTVAHCGKPVRAKGRCRSHYREYLRGDKTCKATDCSKRVHTRQLCRRHYQEWLDNRPQS
jgi:hypothetical protein